MPKITQERKAERREQILAGARRCFAAYGYEGATVARLEDEIGLSRGAIFNYYPSKEDLFLELAWRDNERLVRLWVAKGWEATIRQITTEDPDWLGVYMELSRKMRTDPEFRKRHMGRTDAELAPLLLEHIRTEQKRGALRDDRSLEEIASFISLVANGIAAQVVTGEPIRRLDALIDLVRSAVEPAPA
jgi:TetR/AcrR family transcriptional regulator, transcriptional repressor of aconitase